MFYFKPNFIEKFLWGSVFFFVLFFVFFFLQILAKIKMTRNIKIGYLAAILKRYNILTYFRIMIFL